jgi:hypothetical protein
MPVLPAQIVMEPVGWTAVFIAMEIGKFPACRLRQYSDANSGGDAGYS